MKECNILGVKTYSDPSYIFSGVRTPNPRIYALRSTIGDRAFPVTAIRACISLPPFVRDAPSQVAFRRELKTFLFRSSFPAQ